MQKLPKKWSLRDKTRHLNVDVYSVDDVDSDDCGDVRGVSVDDVAVQDLPPRHHRRPHHQAQHPLDYQFLHLWNCYHCLRKQNPVSLYHRRLVRLMLVGLTRAKILTLILICAAILAVVVMPVDCYHLAVAIFVDLVA